jgi:hypothetical protein
VITQIVAYQSEETEMNDEDFEPETEEISITCKWESTLTVEVPKGWRPGSSLDDFPESVLDQITSETAELVDWS